jgi:shikimate dehydrogenase
VTGTDTVATAPLPALAGRARDGEYVVGLIGAGIGPSLSPALHEREGLRLGLRYRYLRHDLDRLGLRPGAVGALLAAARLAGHRGVNVTHPCKQLVIPHLDELSADAAAIGAVNTVVFDGGRAIGHNTDWSGFGAGLRAGLPGAATGHVVLLGAGGAGAAAAHALLALGTTRLDVVDVDPDRARRLVDRLAARFPGCSVDPGAPDRGLAGRLAGADGLVNATPIGMAGHPGLPVPAALLAARLWVADIVYRPLDTALLRAARVAGCATLDGGQMAVHQAAEAFRLFTGVEPDPSSMLEHFAALVGAEERDGR